MFIKLSSEYKNKIKKRNVFMCKIKLNTINMIQKNYGEH